MTRENRARVAGWLAVAVAALALTGLAEVLFGEARHPRRVFRVRFEDLGTLKAQDAVVLRGVEIGRVRSMELSDGQTLADLELYQDAFIPADSRFVNMNISLMGARRIVLLPGRSRDPMREDQVQDGVFGGGISEKIARVRLLIGQIAAVRAQAERLVSDSGALSPRMFAALGSGLDGLNRVSTRLEESDRSLRAGLASFDALGKMARGGMRNGKLDSVEKNADALLAAERASERGLDAALRPAEKLLAVLQDSSAAKLLDDREVYEDLRRSVVTLQGAVSALEGKKLGKLVRWGNLHFFRSGKE